MKIKEAGIILIVLMLFSFLGCKKQDSPAEPLPAPEPTATFKMAVVSNKHESDIQAYLMQSDGTGSTRVGYTAGTTYQADYCANTDKVVYDDSGGYIRVANSDATGDSAVTATSLYSLPVWKPDGSKIACVKSGDIVVMDANGANEINATSNTLNCHYPAWSKDGSKISYVENVNGVYSGTKIHIMDPDGSNQTYVGPGGNTRSVTGMSFSPDGSKIAYVANENWNTFYIGIIDVDGANDTILWSGTTYTGSIRWMDDNMLYVTQEDAPGTYEGVIYRMNSDGSGKTAITSGADAYYFNFMLWT